MQNQLEQPAPTSAHRSNGSGIPSIAPQSDSPDHLANALLQSLMRQLEGPFSFGLFSTLLLVLISLGLLPLAMLPSRLRAFTRRERDQLWHLAQWLRVQFGAEAEGVWDPTPGMNRLIALSRLLVYASVTVLLVLFFAFLGRGESIPNLFDATFGLAGQPADQFNPARSPLFFWWVAWLSIGYAACWLANLGHQARVHGFIERFNKLSASKGIAPVSTPSITFGLHPVWLIIGLICAANGLVWALPAALAGAAQRRYTRRSSQAIRVELARRVRDILAKSRPEMRLTVPVMLRRKCMTQRCEMRLPSHAVFCPRCGKKVEPAA